MAQAIETLTTHVARITEENGAVKQAMEVMNTRMVHNEVPSHNTIMPKDFRPRSFAGRKYPAWADDFKAYLGYKKPVILEAVKWTESITQ